MTEYMPLGGGSFTGPVELHDDAKSAFEPVTRRQLAHGMEPEEDDAPAVEDGVAPTVTLSIRGAIRSAVVVWTALSGVHGHGYYEVEVDTSINFDSVNLQSGQTRGLIMGFDDLVPGAVYYCRLRAKDAEGNLSGWSSTVNTTLGKADTVDINDDSITAPLIQAGEIASGHIATSGLDAGHIKFGEMSGDRIAANSLYADRINGGDINGVTITGNTITGGTVRTAASGDRVELTGAVKDRIVWYVGASGNSSIVGTIGGLYAYPKRDDGTTGLFRIAGDLTVTGSKNAEIAPDPVGDPTRALRFAATESNTPGIIEVDCGPITIGSSRELTLKDVDLPDAFLADYVKIGKHPKVRLFAAGPRENTDPHQPYGWAVWDQLNPKIEVRGPAGDYYLELRFTRNDAGVQDWMHETVVEREEAA